MSPVGRLNAGGRQQEWAGLLPGLPVPTASGPFQLLRLTAQALEYLEYPMPWARLMVLSGAAFRVPSPCPLAPLAAEQRECLLTGLARLGFEEQRLLRSRQGLSGPEIVHAVTVETGAGRPVLLHGWTPCPGGFSLIAGLGPGGVICGYTPESTAGAPYIGAAPAGDLLLTLGPPSAREEELFVTGCAAAEAEWKAWPESGAELYVAWQWLLEHAATPGLSAQLGAGLAALVEARGAAQDFLQGVTPDLTPLPAAWARRAADHYERMLERLEPLAERLSEVEDAGPEPEQAQASTVAALEELATLDAEALDSLHSAPTATYTPPRW